MSDKNVCVGGIPNYATCLEYCDGNMSGCLTYVQGKRSVCQHYLLLKRAEDTHRDRSSDLEVAVDEFKLRRVM